MRLKRTNLWLPLLGIALAGCGGGGEVTAQANPFSGNYRGNWDLYEEFGGPDPLALGNAVVSVSDKGIVTGIFSEQTPTARSGSIHGSLQADGTLAFDVAYPAGAVSYTGKLERNGMALDGPVYERGFLGAFPAIHLLPSDL